MILMATPITEWLLLKRPSGKHIEDEVERVARNKKDWEEVDAVGNPLQGDQSICHTQGEATYQSTKTTF